MNAFVKGIHAAQGTPVIPEKAKSLDDWYSELTLHLLHAKGTLIVVETAVSEKFAENHKQVALGLSQAHTLLEYVKEGISAIAEQIGTGSVYLKKVDQALATLELLINGSHEIVNKDDVSFAIYGLYLTIERFYETEIDGLWQLMLKTKTKEEIFH